MFLAIRPPAVRDPRCGEKIERRFLTAVRLAPHCRSVHWLDLSNGTHNSIFAADCYKSVTVASAATRSCARKCTHSDGMIIADATSRL